MSTAAVYDFVIVGSGFGGSVSAMRLSEKGYQVLVLERGRRFKEEDLPRSNWNIWRYLWLPALGCYGILEMSLSRGYFVYHGSGVGGGSLVYAAVLMEPNADFFNSPSWSAFGDWQKILRPHYDVARKMLGVNTNPRLWSADQALKQVAVEFGYGDTFRPTDVGIFFGEPGKKVPDPFFNGKGPDRIGCTLCGACMVGCRDNAKNSLDKNYLYFAEKMKAEVRTDAKVHAVYPIESGNFGDARYTVHYHSPSSPFGKSQTVFAKNVIFSAGVLGTVSILLHCRDVIHSLPLLSKQLGMNVRTNSEAFLGAFSRKGTDNHSKGLAISSIFHADDKTQVEPVRLPAGSSMLFIVLSSPMISRSRHFVSRLWLTFLQILKKPMEFFDGKLRPGLSKRGVALMIMQTEDNRMELKLGRNPFALNRKGLIGEKDPEKTIPVNIELGHQVTCAFANKINGYAAGSVTEGLLDVPMTAHILGGCTFGKNAEEGVLGLDCQIHNYPGLYVVDGSIVPANPGVNPSLTITALAEYAMSQIPNKSE